MLALLLSPAFVVATNNPVMWERLTSDDGPRAAIAVSGYVGITAHQAVRLNYATYEVDTLASIWSSVTLADDGNCGYEVGGHSDDLGAGWLYFLRERWRGPSLELGAVRKSLHLTHCYDKDGVFDHATDTTSTAYVARATLGWSWLFHDHLFVSFNAGGSVGREAGLWNDTGKHYHHAVAYPEMYFRLGFAFD